MLKCVDPKARWVKCCVCKKRVKTCERKRSKGGDYRCPRHPNGAQLWNKQWVCSHECWEKFLWQKHKEVHLEKKLINQEVAAFAALLLEYLKSSNNMKRAIIKMAKIIADKESTEDEKQSAIHTILDALL